MPGSQVNAIAIDSSANVWVGGTFTQAGGAGAIMLARWDGAAWSTPRYELAGGPGYAVNALAATTKGLYVAGYFETRFISRSHVSDISCIGLLTDTGWTHVGDAYGTDYPVTAMAVRGEEVVIGGNFSTIGPFPNYFVTLYDGEQWRNMGDGYLVPGETSTSRTINNAPWMLRFKGDSILCGGAFGLIMWTGRRWYTLTADTMVVDAAVDGDDIYLSAITGSYYDDTRQSYLMRWRKGTITTIDNGSLGPARLVASIALRDSTLYAGGDFVYAGDAFSPGLARWSKGAWEPLDTRALHGSGVAVDALAYGDGKLYVGGDFAISELEAESIAMWDGSAWHRIARSVRGAVTGLAIDGGDLYAAGMLDHVDSDAACRVARWDGARWHGLVDSSHLMSRITAMAVKEGELYVGGEFVPEEGRKYYALLRWNGMAWDSIASADGAITALLIDGDDLYCAGAFNTIGVTEACVARWNRASPDWSALPGAFGSNASYHDIDALLKKGDTIYAAGYFDKINSAAARNVARWDGASWQAMGDNLNGPVSALLQYQGTIVAAGYRIMDGADTLYGVAAWDGARWRPLGSDLQHDPNSVSHALAAGDGVLYVGGAFTSAGGKAANGLARWSGALLGVDRSRLSPDRHITSPSIDLLSSDPIENDCVITLRLPALSAARLLLVDMLGRRSRTLVDGHLDAGGHQLSLDLSDLPEGAYYLLLETAEGRASRALRIVR
jgi:hypothetical protein